MITVLLPDLPTSYLKQGDEKEEDEEGPYYFLFKKCENDDEL